MRQAQGIMTEWQREGWFQGRTKSSQDSCGNITDSERWGEKSDTAPGA